MTTHTYNKQLGMIAITSTANIGDTVIINEYPGVQNHLTSLPLLGTFIVKACGNDESDRVPFFYYNNKFEGRCLELQNTGGKRRKSKKSQKRYRKGGRKGSRRTRR